MDKIEFVKIPNTMRVITPNQDFSDIRLNFLAIRYTATVVAVGSALILAFVTGASGNGALKLWPLFGAVNQTLAALALIIITVHLKARGGLKWIISGLPAVFMSVMTIWAVVMNQLKFDTAHNWLLMAVNFCILVIAVWIAIEGIIRFFTTEEAPLEGIPESTV